MTPDMIAILDKVRGMAGQVLEYAGMQLVHLEMHRESRGLILRLYIDKDGGVTLDDCAHVSRQISAQLDMETPSRTATPWKSPPPAWTGRWSRTSISPSSPAG